jgi:hypothetical protein
MKGFVIMRVQDRHPTKYLKSEDAKTKQIVATISHLEMEQVGQDKKEKPVLYFEGSVKPMVLNRTNDEVLDEAFGDSDAWPGRKIKIYCVRTQYQGKSVDGLRVEPIIPKPAPKDDLNDEIPDEFGKGI